MTLTHPTQLAGLASHRIKRRAARAVCARQAGRAAWRPFRAWRARTPTTDTDSTMPTPVAVVASPFSGYPLASAPRVKGA